MDAVFGIEVAAPEQFVGADPEHVGDLDQCVQVRRGMSVLPAVIDAHADSEQFGQSALGEFALGTKLLEALGEVGHVLGGQLEMR
jgi:hypothetical protein